MASQIPSKFKDRLPSKHELVEAILEFVTITLEGRPGVPELEPSSSASNTPPSASDTSNIRCVQFLLKHEPDHVYRFRPNNLAAHVSKRPSFAKLIERWQCASKQRREDGGSFPEVRRRSASNHFNECILRCMCDTCNEGEAVELFCQPRKLGHEKDTQDEVLVHEFRFRSQTWAIIFGTWEGPEDFRVWGAWRDDPNVTAYNEWIQLKEIYRPGLTGHKRRRKSSPVSTEEPLQQLWLSRTKSAPQSAKSASQNTAPDSPTSSLARQMNATLQPLNVRDLEHTYQTIKAYVQEQRDGDGLRIIINNNIIQRHLNALEKHAHDNDDVLFQAMQSSLNQKLMEVGIPALPDV